MPGKTQLIITLNEDGTIEASGPFENKLLCYGLLDIARDIVFHHHNAKRIEPGDLGTIEKLSSFRRN